MTFHFIFLVIISILLIVIFLFIVNYKKQKLLEKIIIDALSKMLNEDKFNLIDLNQFKSNELKIISKMINNFGEAFFNNKKENIKLEKVRSEFLGNVSHELRTPIFTVQGFLETILDNENLEESIRNSFVEKAHRNILILNNLLTDLIEISKIESGEMRMNFRYFNPNEEFIDIINDLEPTAEQANIKLNYNYVGSEKDNILILGDKEKLKQVIGNLIENAIKYNKPNGNVTLEVTPLEDEVSICIIDNGIGIDNEDIPRLFERFYRVNKSRSRSVGGTGLGLAIVKHIIEAHETQINVISTLGVGTTFKFNLKKIGKSNKNS